MKRTFYLTFTAIERFYSRLGYQNIRTQFNERLQAHETLNDFIVYMKTNDPEKKEKLVRQGRVRGHESLEIHALP